MPDQDPRVEAVGEALSVFFEGGWRGHYCAEWQAEGRCQLCVDAAHTALAAADAVEDRPDGVDRLANDLAGDWRERAERAEADVTMWKTRLVEETARLRELLTAARSSSEPSRVLECERCEGYGLLLASANDNAARWEARCEALTEALRGVYGWLPGLIPGELLAEVDAALSGVVAPPEDQP